MKETAEEGGDPLRSRTLGNILRTSRCFRLYCRRALGDTGLKPAQQLMLSHICRRPGMAQEELSAALILDKTTVAHQLVKLEALGYLTRSPSPEDGRCRHIYPTEKGEEVYPRIREAFARFSEGLLTGLRPEEQETLERLSEKLLSNARELTEGASAGGEAL